MSDILEKKSIIRFENELDLDGVEDLFDYLGKNLPGEIIYSVKTHKYFHSPEMSGDYEHETRSAGVAGTIKKYTPPYTFDSFSLNNSDASSLRFVSMEFSTILGYSLDEHRKEVRDLWDEVREQTSRFLHKMNDQINMNFLHKNLGTIK